MKKIFSEKENVRAIANAPLGIMAGSNSKQPIDGDTALVAGAYTLRCKAIKIRIFYRASYATPEYYEDEINEFLESLSEKGNQISITFFESMTYIAYQTK
jgi:hypothetical protein